MVDHCFSPTRGFICGGGQNLPNIIKLNLLQFKHWEMQQDFGELLIEQVINACHGGANQQQVVYLLVEKHHQGKVNN